MNLPKNDRDQRRMIERLSGWRLVTFFVLLSLNLIALGLLGLCVLAPGPYWQAVFVSILSAQVALMAVAIGAFRFTVIAKFSFIFVHWIACIVAIGQFSTFGLLSQVALESFVVFISQSIILCGVTTLWGYRKTNRHSFQIRDVLAMTLLVSMVMSSTEYFLPNWKILWNAQQFSGYRAGWTGLVNSLWCFAILSCFVDGVVPLKGSGRYQIARASQSLVLFLAAFCLESGLLFGTMDKSSWVMQRVVFASWFGLCLIPVIGLSAHPGVRQWITPTEFYRRVRRSSGGSQARAPKGAVATIPAVTTK